MPCFFTAYHVLLELGAGPRLKILTALHQLGCCPCLLTTLLFLYVSETP